MSVLESNHVRESAGQSAVTLDRPMRFTFDQYMRMAEQEILTGRVELIDGEISEMSPIGNLHAVCCSRLYNRLFAHWPEPKFIRIQATHRFSKQLALEPDIALMSAAPVDGAEVDEIPQLVIEVSNSSLQHDLGRKVLLYARERVPEYWVANLKERQIHVFRGPRPEASQTADAWRESKIVGADESVAPLCASEAVIRVGEVIPSASEA